jgi:hypothetical protein
MLFNADRNMKDNLFQMYKRDALEQVSKKNEMKMQKINEDRMYLDNIMQREKVEAERKQMEKMRKINETMGEYNEMLTRKNDNPLLKRSKFEDVRINSYGVTPSNMNMGNLNSNMNNNFNYNNNNNNNYPNDFTSNLEYNKKSLSPRGPRESVIKNFIFNHDSTNSNLNNPYVNNKVTDYDYMKRTQKMEQQKLYKNSLDTQVIIYITNIIVAK